MRRKGDVSAHLRFTEDKDDTMAPRLRTRSLFLWMPSLFCILGSAKGDSICGPDGLQSSGSIYRICMPLPQDYNGSVVIWAHGFQDAGTPIQIPEDQLNLDGFSLPEIVNGLGFGFATNSYSKTGLAVRQGMEDILDLVDLYAAEQGTPDNVYLTGASEGGIITALLIEQNPHVFKGGLSMCGPIGDFPLQINYFGDARVTFEVFFPGLIPGDQLDPPRVLRDNWTDYYETVVKPTILAPANRSLLNQWVAVATLPFDAGNYLETAEVSAHDVLRYAVVNLQDAAETLGGFPFDNTNRWYSGSSHDLLLNLIVRRSAADPAAILEMETFYNTTGELQIPLITLHTLLDQQIPFLQELIYIARTFEVGTLPSHHYPLAVDRYGHCNFTAVEVVVAFALVLAYTGDLDLLTGVGSVLQGEQLASFERSANRLGLPFRVEGEALTIIKSR